jgi:hypothetical protein
VANSPDPTPSSSVNVFPLNRRASAVMEIDDAGVPAVPAEEKLLIAIL